jgi:hypothetical protein
MRSVPELSREYGAFDLDQQPEQTMRAALQQLIQAAEAGEPRQLRAAIDNARRFL